jgi:2-iminobutanoate/2-iminopropanoate deaminase
MNQKTLVNTKLAPPAVGPYTQAVTYRNVLYVSGQLGATPTDPHLPQDFVSEVKNALYNLKAIIEAAGSKMEKVLKVTVLLTDMGHFQTMNDIYIRFFPENYPARECYAVKELPKNARIEISAIAYVRDDT